VEEEENTLSAHPRRELMRGGVKKQDLVGDESSRIPLEVSSGGSRMTEGEGGAGYITY